METLLARLRTRTTNAFGQHPDELAAALQHQGDERLYRALGATVIDASQPVADVASAILAAAAEAITASRVE